MQSSTITVNAVAADVVFAVCDNSKRGSANYRAFACHPLKIKQ
jgi:hypothetical protein